MQALTPGAAPLGGIARCPYENKATEATPQAAQDSVGSSAESPDLAPCHQWLAKPIVHTPVPAVPVGAWDNGEHYNVVAVGAGMGSLYTLWRLNQDAQKPGTEAVFERTHHVGGRVHTAPVDGAGWPLDVGAMRWAPTEHTLVNGLAEHFNIPAHEFVVGGDNNLQYFRGTRLTNQQVAQNPSLLPFHLRPEEQGKTANELLEMAIGAVIPNFKDLDAAGWEAAKKNTTVPVTDPESGATSQVPLYQLGFRNVLARTLSSEAIDLITDSEGYQNLMQNWDAGQAMQTFSNSFKPGITYKTPVKGMTEFPRALAGDLHKAGTQFFKETTLRQVGWDPDKKQFHLTFQDSKGNVRPVTADKLVLGMPKQPMADLIEDSPFLQGTPLENNLNTVKPNALTRIFLTFDPDPQTGKPWWNDLGIQSGRSLADNNLGQVYYYGEPGDKRPYIQVYCDGSNSEFWEGLQNPANPGVETTLCATPQLVAEVKRQLEELHGRPIPNPTGALYKRWADQFFGGATHTWNAGSKPFETSDAMVEPVPGVPLFVVGEAWSTVQGWMEGALRQGEKAHTLMTAAPAPAPPAPTPPAPAPPATATCPVSH